jgi:hypothetical protein
MVNAKRLYATRNLVRTIDFILLINDLSTSSMLHKYVDDSTLSEFLKKGELSFMDIYFDMAVDWSKANLMNINSEHKRNVRRFSRYQRNK